MGNAHAHMDIMMMAISAMNVLNYAKYAVGVVIRSAHNVEQATE